MYNTVFEEDEAFQKHADFQVQRLVEAMLFRKIWGKHMLLDGMKLGVSLPCHAHASSRLFQY